MCRWLCVFSVDPFAVSDVLLAPSNSLRQQASDEGAFTPGLRPNSVRNHGVNPDGHGFGYFDDDGKPHVYVSPLPSWKDPGLEAAVGGTRTRTLLAHVRAATPGLPVLAASCHPFHFGAFMFVQNGGLGGFKSGGPLAQLISEAVGPDFAELTARPSDTAHAFAYFLCRLRFRGGDPHKSGNPPLVVARALQDAMDGIMLLQAAAGIPPEDRASSFNFCTTDGVSFVATRDRLGWSGGAAETPTQLPEAPSLYIAKGSGIRINPATGDLQMLHEGGLARVVVVSSEPLTLGTSPQFASFGWEAVENDTAVGAERRTDESGGGDYVVVRMRDLQWNPPPEDPEEALRKVLAGDLTVKGFSVHRGEAGTIELSMPEDRFWEVTRRLKKTAEMSNMGPTAL
ncbi:hypothetical protein DFJ74DRAFT_344457 [Hyaloraphidium curvatum]|nr:hypothetical protein DFJ74DRAFT_344457 [Hyaloraphidium curvatum]